MLRLKSLKFLASFSKMAAKAYFFHLSKSASIIDSYRINRLFGSSAKLTVASFDVDVDAHLDPAEDFVLCHRHLHGRNLRFTTHLDLTGKYSEVVPGFV